MNNIYRYQYFIESKDPLLHQMRDLTIFVELLSILNERGFFYKDVLLNYPNLKEKDEIPFTFTDEDLMVLTTRPPVSDQNHDRIIYSTNHIFEIELRKILKQHCFKILSRQYLILKGPVARYLKSGFKDRARISFYLNKSKKNTSAAYVTVSKINDNLKTTKFRDISDVPKSCAFIILLQKTEFLPRTLIVFGIGGQEGFIFSRLLRNGLWDKLNIDLHNQSRMIMVEFPISRKKIKTRSLKFVEEMTYEIILDKELEISS